MTKDGIRDIEVQLTLQNIEQIQDNIRNLQEKLDELKNKYILLTGAKYYEKTDSNHSDFS